MRKTLILIRFENTIYKLDSSSDNSMDTLFLLLINGLGPESYLKFTNDKDCIRLGSNIITLIKVDDCIQVFADEYIFPEYTPFITTLENFKKIIIEWYRLKSLGGNKIEFHFFDDNLTIEYE